MKLLTDRNLTLINFAIVFFFLLIYALYVFKIDVVIIGVLQEMFFFPLLVAQVVFVVIGINYVVKHKKKPLTIISLFTLIVCSILTIGSFF